MLQISYVQVDEWYEQTKGVSFASMILSALLLGLGFVNRVVKLHRGLSVDLMAWVRNAVSVRLRRVLLFVYTRLNIQSSPGSLRQTLIYRPLLAAFLVLRVGVDAWGSMFVEVM